MIGGVEQSLAELCVDEFRDAVSLNFGETECVSSPWHSIKARRSRGRPKMVDSIDCVLDGILLAFVRPLVDIFWIVTRKRQ